jgi:hypothetical protein
MILPIAHTVERTRTATAPSHAIPITLPIELAGTTPKTVDRITLINVIITACDGRLFSYNSTDHMYWKKDTYCNSVDVHTNVHKTDHRFQNGKSL